MVIPITFKHLLNEQHQTFHLAVKALVEKYTAETLGLTTQFADYLVQLALEKSVLEPIRKSQFTDGINLADVSRDNLGRGLTLTVEGACFHYDEQKKSAALRLKVVTDHYGNLAVKMLDEETGAINNIIEEMRSNYAAELTALGLSGWLDALEQKNNLVTTLLAQRGSETTDNSGLSMVEVRRLVDNAYKAMIRRVEALVELNGLAAHAAFIGELNTQIERSKRIIAQRKGAANSGNEGNTGEGEVNEGEDGEITPNPLP